MDQTTHRRSDLVALPYVPADEDDGGTRVITVRVPATLHEELKRVAHRQETSLNLLCTSKLIAAIDACPIVPLGSKFDRSAFAEWRDREVITRRCRVCGRGAPALAAWPEWDLCSACVPVAAREEQGAKP